MIYFDFRWICSISNKMWKSQINPFIEAHDWFLVHRDSCFGTSKSMGSVIIGYWLIISHMLPVLYAFSSFEVVYAIDTILFAIECVATCALWLRTPYMYDQYFIYDETRLVAKVFALGTVLLIIFVCLTFLAQFASQVLFYFQMATIIYGTCFATLLSLTLTQYINQRVTEALLLKSKTTNFASSYLKSQMEMHETELKKSSDNKSAANDASMTNSLSKTKPNGQFAVVMPPNDVDSSTDASAAMSQKSINGDAQKSTRDLIRAALKTSEILEAFTQHLCHEYSFETMLSIIEFIQYKKRIVKEDKICKHLPVADIKTFLDTIYVEFPHASVPRSYIVHYDKFDDKRRKSLEMRRKSTLMHRLVMKLGKDNLDGGIKNLEDCQLKDPNQSAANKNDDSTSYGIFSRQKTNFNTTTYFSDHNLDENENNRRQSASVSMEETTLSNAAYTRQNEFTITATFYLDVIDKLCEKYIHPDSPLEINISTQMRKQLLEQRDSIEATIVEEQKILEDLSISSTNIKTKSISGSKTKLKGFYTSIFMLFDDSIAEMYKMLEDGYKRFLKNPQSKGIATSNA